MNEHEMTELMERAGAALDPDVAGLVAAGAARGRRVRRWRQAGATLTVVAAVAAIGLAANAVATGPGTAAPDRTPPAATDGPEPALAAGDLVVVSARDVPDVFAEQLPGHTVGTAIRRGATTTYVDRPEVKTVFFDVDGTQTLFSIRPSAHYPRCQVLALYDPDLGCDIVDGVEIGTSAPAPGDGVTYWSVTARVHGFEVSAGSYNASAGKDVPPLTDVPPISVEQLTALVTSDVWFADGAPDEPPAVPLEIPTLTAAAQLPAIVTSVVPGTVVRDEAAGGYVSEADQQVAHFRLDGTPMSVTTTLELDGVPPLRRCHRGPWECVSTTGDMVVSHYEYAGSTHVAVFRDGYTVDLATTGLDPSGQVLEQIALGDGWLAE
jgi:hypothetical protein